MYDEGAGEGTVGCRQSISSREASRVDLNASTTGAFGEAGLEETTDTYTVLLLHVCGQWGRRTLMKLMSSLSTAHMLIGFGG